MSGQNDASKANGQKKGFWAVLKDSIAKSNDGCGPGCGCHAGDAKTEKGRKVAEDGRKK